MLDSESIQRRGTEIEGGIERRGAMSPKNAGAIAGRCNEARAGCGVLGEVVGRRRSDAVQLGATASAGGKRSERVTTVGGKVRSSSAGFSAGLFATVAIPYSQCLKRECNWSEDHRDHQCQSDKVPDSFAECSSICVAQSHVLVLSLDVRPVKFLPLSSLLARWPSALLG
jgi:hypothetical protein